METACRSLRPDCTRSDFPKYPGRDTTRQPRLAAAAGAAQLEVLRAQRTPRCFAGAPTTDTDFVRLALVRRRPGDLPSVQVRGQPRAGQATSPGRPAPRPGPPAAHQYRGHAVPSGHWPLLHLDSVKDAPNDTLCFPLPSFLTSPEALV